MSGTGDPAAPRRRGLGMGLAALLAGGDGPAGADMQAGLRELPIEQLRPSPLQPRRRFAAEDLETLAQSIRERGVLQPLLVRPMPEGGFEIVAGERRWRAAQLAGLHQVPAILRPLDDRQTLELALIENLQRADLNAIEEATAYRRLLGEFGHTQEALAEAVGRSRSHVANTMRLLGLPAPVQEMVVQGQLSAGHARALIGTPDPAALAAEVVARGLSVRDTEALAQRAIAGRRSAAAARVPDPNLAELERSLSQRLGLTISIQPKVNGKGGTITLRYSRDAQLEALLERLG